MGATLSPLPPNVQVYQRLTIANRSGSEGKQGSNGWCCALLGGIWHNLDELLSMFNAHFNFNTLLFFNMLQDTEKILRRRVTAGSEHTNEAFGIFAS